MPRRFLFASLFACLSVLTTLIASELLLAWWAPEPRIQIIRPHGMGSSEPRDMEVVDDVPLWTFPDHGPRYARDCLVEHPDAVRVVVMGSSIFAGVSIPPTEVFTRRLAERLGTDKPVCILNLSEAAYGFQNQAKVARRELPEIRPDLVIWEMWGNSLWPYTLVGGTAYRFRELIVGNDGTPNPLRTWPPLHRFLLPRSRLYELAVLSMATPMHPKWARKQKREFAETVMKDTLRWVRDDLGADILTVFCPVLYTPFPEQVDRRHAEDPAIRDDRYESMEAVIDALEIPKLHLDELFAEAGIDHEPIRLDPCCHYNLEGQEVLAQILEPHIASRLQALTPDASGAPETDTPD
jgi:hypothetical protein